MTAFFGAASTFGRLPWENLMGSFLCTVCLSVHNFVTDLTRSGATLFCVLDEMYLQFSLLGAKGP